MKSHRGSDPHTHDDESKPPNRPGSIISSTSLTSHTFIPHPHPHLSPMDHIMKIFGNNQKELTNDEADATNVAATTSVGPALQGVPFNVDARKVSFITSRLDNSAYEEWTSIRKEVSWKAAEEAVKGLVRILPSLFIVALRLTLYAADRPLFVYKDIFWRLPYLSRIWHPCLGRFQASP